MVCFPLLAQKYECLDLEAQLVEHAKMDASDAFDYLASARLLSNASLERKCLDVIDVTAEAAFGTDAFVELSHETLCELLARETLAIREVKLFAAVLRWAKAECRRRRMPAHAENIRAVLGTKVIHAIRFATMSVEEFAACVGN